jgi:hypothetical protein
MTSVLFLLFTSCLVWVAMVGIVISKSMNQSRSIVGQLEDDMLSVGHNRRNARKRWDSINLTVLEYVH